MRFIRLPLTSAFPRSCDSHGRSGVGDQAVIRGFMINSVCFFNGKVSSGILESWSCVYVAVLPSCDVYTLLFLGSATLCLKCKCNIYLFVYFIAHYNSKWI